VINHIIAGNIVSSSGPGNIMKIQVGYGGGYLLAIFVINGIVN